MLHHWFTTRIATFRLPKMFVFIKFVYSYRGNYCNSITRGLKLWFFFRLQWSNLEWYIWIDINQWYSNICQCGMERFLKWKQKYRRLGLWNWQTGCSNLLFQGTSSESLTLIEISLMIQVWALFWIIKILRIWKGDKSNWFRSNYYYTNSTLYSNHSASPIPSTWQNYGNFADDH